MRGSNRSVRRRTVPAPDLTPAARALRCTAEDRAAGHGSSGVTPFVPARAHCGRVIPANHMDYGRVAREMFGRRPPPASEPGPCGHSYVRSCSHPEESGVGLGVPTGGASPGTTGLSTALRRDALTGQVAQPRRGGRRCMPRVRLGMPHLSARHCDGGAGTRLPFRTGREACPLVFGCVLRCRQGRHVSGPRRRPGLQHGRRRPGRAHCPERRPSKVPVQDRWNRPLWRGPCWRARRTRPCSCPGTALELPSRAVAGCPMRTDH